MTKKILGMIKRLAPITGTIRIILSIVVLFAGTGILFLLFYPLKTSEQLNIPLQRLPEYPTSTYEEKLKEALRTSENKILSREVIIDISASELKGKFILHIPSSSPLVNEITHERVEENILSFVELIFGKVSIPFEKEQRLFDDKDQFQLSWTINSHEETLHLIILAQKALPENFGAISYTPSSVVPSADHDKFLVNYYGFRTSYLSPVASNLDLTGNRISLERQNQPLERLFLGFRPINSETSSSSNTTSTISRQIILQDLDNWLGSIPFISTIFYAILEAIPLLLFLRIYRQDTDHKNDTLSIIAITINALLLFHFTLYILSAFTNWFFDSTVISSLSKYVLSRTGMYFRLLPDQVFEWSSYYFGVIILGVWVPLIFFNWWEYRNSTSKQKDSILILLLSFLTPLLVVFVISGTLSAYLIVEKSYAAFTLADIISQTETIIFLIVYSIFTLLIIGITYRENLHKENMSWLSWMHQLATFVLRWVLWIPILVGAASLLFIFIFVNQFLDPITFTDLFVHILAITPLWAWVLFLLSGVGIIINIAVRGLVKNFVDRELSITMALYSVGLLGVFGYLQVKGLDNTFYDLPNGFEWIVLLIVFGALLIASFESLIIGAIENKLDKPVIAKSHLKWLWLSAFILALPMRVLTLPTQAQLLSFTELYEVAYALDNLLLFFWLAGILWFLREEGKKDTKIDTPTYQIGLLASAAMLFNVTSRWFFLPLTFMIGWLCLRYLIQVDREWEKKQEIHEYVDKNRNSLLERIINLNTINPSFDDFRKKVTERFSKTNTTFAKFDHTIIERRERLDKQMKKSYIFNTHPKDLVFAFGPFESSWKNAMHGVQWAIILALPWLVLYMRNFLSAKEIPDTFSLLNYLVNFLYILIRWVGMGFVFGYFFPHIRGSSGVSKGFWLFLATFVASIPLAMLYRVSASDWRALLFWGLQIFIEYMLLGLIAFDYWTLRKDGRGWQMLFDVHGIAKLGISVSTILAAIGGTVIALLTSQATNLIGVSLKFIFPDLPSDFLPK